jgi:hypothetical protein
MNSLAATRTISCIAAIILNATSVQIALAQDSQAAPPAPSRVAANGSRVTANVLARKVWPPGSLENVPPSVPADQTLYSVSLKLIASEPNSPETSNLAETGRTLDAFSSIEIPETLVGKTVTAVLTLTGGTDGVRWVISDCKPLP